MVAIYEVDPEADALLIVRRPSRELTVWEDHFVKTNGLAAHPELHMKVSSKHLSLASKVLKGRCASAANDHAHPDGRLHLVLEAFDFAPVKIVMDIIHGRGRRVPRSVDLNTLAKIAVYVDKFHLHDTVDVYADRWISQLESSIPSSYSRDLVLWVYISYVFHRTDLFEDVTKTAIATSKGPLPSLGLPIREAILRDIETRRHAVVSQAIGKIHETVKQLRSDDVSCTENCDSVLLGSLVKALPDGLLLQPAHDAVPAELKVASHKVSLIGLTEAIHHVSHAEPHNLQVTPTHEPTPSRKRKSPHPPADSRPMQLPTPSASPEPTFQHENGILEVHHCAARDVDLPDLESLGAATPGLELESSLGYYVY